jgi:hypothetical protein
MFTLYFAPHSVLAGVHLGSGAFLRRLAARKEEIVGNHTIKRLLLATSILLVGAAWSASANAASLRQGQDATGATVTGALPGEVYWTDYSVGTEDFSGDTYIGGDGILRLINPNGSANSGITGESGHTVCAMIYVLDDDEEMVECCGCSLSSARFKSFSVEHNLLSHQIDGGAGVATDGVIAVVAASSNSTIKTSGSPNNGNGCTVTQSGACNSGCDPTNNPGYAVTTGNNLLGSLTSSKKVDSVGPAAVLEVALHDDGAGDPNNLLYLQNECGELVGNGTRGGICKCPKP